MSTKDQELITWAVNGYTAAGWRVTQRNEYGVQLERTTRTGAGPIIVSVVLTIIFTIILSLAFFLFGLMAFVIGTAVVIYQIVSVNTERLWIDAATAKQMAQNWHRQRGSQPPTSL